MNYTIHQTKRREFEQAVAREDAAQADLWEEFELDELIDVIDALEARGAI